MRFKGKTSFYIFVAILCVGIPYSVVLQFQNRARQAAYDAVATGDIHGNSESRVFHVPSCPDYNTFNMNNLTIFKTVEQAERARYRPARNCLDAVDLRRHVDNWDGEIWHDADRDGPR